jgi:hypothetical protein
MSSVPPAREKYSPPDKDVGMQMRGIAGGFTPVLGVLASIEYPARSLGSIMLFARAYSVSSDMF